MRYLILIVALLSVTACAQVTDRDGGIGGTGVPADQIAL